MKILIQKVLSAHVEVNGATVGSIGEGLLLYVGITHTDTKKECIAAVEKLHNLRLFPNEDQSAYFDKNLIEAAGAFLVVSQFTLYGSLNKGRRPSFDEAMAPVEAEKVYDYFVKTLHEYTSQQVQTGVFGAHMHVHSVNNGPVTFILEL